MHMINAKGEAVYYNMVTKNGAVRGREGLHENWTCRCRQP